MSSTDIGLAFGAGRYGGEYRGSRHDSVFGEAEIASSVSTNVALVANVQYRSWNSEGNRYWLLPFTAGIRIF
jgi:hypothetical protein